VLSKSQEAIKEFMRQHIEDLRKAGKQMCTEEEMEAAVYANCGPVVEEYKEEIMRESVKRHLVETLQGIVRDGVPGKDEETNERMKRNALAILESAGEAESAATE